MQLKASRTFRHGSTTFRRGMAVEGLNDATAKQLTDAGLVVASGAKATAEAEDEAVTTAKRRGRPPAARD